MNTIYLILSLLVIFCSDINASSVFVKYDSSFGMADSLDKVQRFFDEKEYNKLIYIPIQITKDGIPVVSSHKDLSKVSTLPGSIKDYTFDNLREIDLISNSYYKNKSYSKNLEDKIRSIDDFIDFNKINGIANASVIIELLDSPLSSFSTLKLLGDYFSSDVIKYSYFLVKNPEQKSFLSYYNYMSNDAIPVLCDVSFSSVVKDYKGSKGYFVSPIKHCTKSGVIIDFDYENINCPMSELLGILSEYINFLNEKNFADKVFIDLHKNISNHMVEVLGKIGINGIFIDTDFSDISDEIFDLDGFKNSQNWKNCLDRIGKNSEE